MKIFVSYARVDKPYCVRIIETLRAHDVWYDQRLYAGQDWWKEILRRLDWCEVFIYLLSPDSVASQYCRRELDIARRLKRQIIPALIHRDTALPDALRDWQYVDLSQQLTVENVTQLLNAILMAERRGSSKTTLPAVAREASPLPAAGPAQLVSEALLALEADEYDRAIVLIKQAQAGGYQSRFVPLDKLLRVAEAEIAKRSKSQEAQREYQHIVALFAYESARDMACEALDAFAAEYGDYDPNNLRRYCASADPSSAIISRDDHNARDLARSSKPTIQRVKASPQTAATKPTVRRRMIDARKIAEAPDNEEILPLLHWRDIPYGVVTISSIVGADEDFGEKTVQVDNFVMSQYPVTNAQFAIFAKAADGYSNERWWRFSEHAARWRKNSGGPADSHFSGDRRPRENVNWYEAMAFAGWLSSLLKMRIALPTIAQWQRAAKGDDDRYFPWGDEYHEEHCNTLESGLKSTTPVDRYRKGLSPYGVYDLAGNIWEWTMNTAPPTESGRDQRRAVAGGSYVSPCDRAQTAHRHYLDPRVRYSSIGIRLVGLP